MAGLTNFKLSPAVSGLSVGVQILILTLTTLFFVLLRRRYYSPISHIPGPFLASISRLWHLRQIWSGKQNLKILEQHEKYGK